MIKRDDVFFKLYSNARHDMNWVPLVDPSLMVQVLLIRVD